MRAKTKRINPYKEGSLIFGYVLIMPMKRDLCTTISNPFGYAIVRVIEATVPRKSPHSYK